VSEKVARDFQRRDPTPDQAYRYGGERQFVELAKALVVEMLQ
jgi:hypothetical protein